MANQGKPAEAILHFERALQFRPTIPKPIMIWDWSWPTKRSGMKPFPISNEGCI
jgi:hypothetical protein